ncbi:LytTR family DNA-binding domain-containing protein [Apibacter raozihei]|uniref:LytR/AlgR family response regulator transcription factor n=1 Tax=Apibacter raozihei TaxID=2500547 RepID=UPI000FE2F094|nr:LytTR family DNA-binding domain-containing protein [Apibacter raozihei]
MNCIIVDDEPLAREGIQLMVEKTSLKLLGSFNNADSAQNFLILNNVDLIFLDIRMPGTSGIEFAKSISKNTLIIFTTAYTEYACESYEVDAIDYLLKPIDENRFFKAVNKATSYNKLLKSAEKEQLATINEKYIFVKSERRYFKINFEEILFIEGLKDYVIIQTDKQRIITKMNLKNIHAYLPKNIFFRINKSYIINTHHIDSFDSNDVHIQSYEISIGNIYRNNFLDLFFKK